MTTETDVTNRALQLIGTRTNISSLSEQSNEAIQASLVIDQLRDDLLRMAPWDCAFNFANLNLITAAPGTPENTTAGTQLWQKGQPAPPWAYEYAYPVDCLRACMIIPQFQTGFAGGIPITTAVTGGAASFWQGPPVRYKITIDQFYPVTAATAAVGGTGFNVGDILTLALGPNTSAPIGYPAKLVVLTAPGGVIGTVGVVNQISGSAVAQGGSYFATQTNPVAMSSVAGFNGNPSAGVGATFNLTFGPQSSQRVILTNQEFATLGYVKQITDPNLMDPLFIDAWTAILGSRLVMALTGDKAQANLQVVMANNYVTEARKVDGNEGLTINDVTPDWIRVRGIWYTDYEYSPNNMFNWGNSFPLY